MPGVRAVRSDRGKRQRRKTACPIIVLPEDQALENLPRYIPIPCPRASWARHLPAKSQVKMDKEKGVGWKWRQRGLRSQDLGYHPDSAPYKLTCDAIAQRAKLRLPGAACHALHDQLLSPHLLCAPLPSTAPPTCPCTLPHTYPYTQAPSAPTIAKDLEFFKHLILFLAPVPLHILLLLPSCPPAHPLHKLFLSIS